MMTLLEKSQISKLRVALDIALQRITELERELAGAGVDLDMVITPTHSAINQIEPVLVGLEEENERLKAQLQERGERMERLFQWVGHVFMEKAGQAFTYKMFREWFTDEGKAK